MSESIEPTELAEPFLHLANVNVVRGTTKVLHDINLTIRRGEHIALLGPNGCGKSTLLKTMTCELYPLAEPGMEVTIFGRPRWDLTELKKKLGVVSAELPGKHFLQATGFDAILTGFFSSSTLWPNLTVTPAMRERTEAILGQIDAVELRDKPVGEMSAGQQRRILIARALVGSAGTLLLDEPSNALDLAAQRDLRELLRQLVQQGTTLVLITHHIADIVPEIERVVLMREGRVVGDGRKRDLLTERGLSDLFETEIHLTEMGGFYQAW